MPLTIIDSDILIELIRGDSVAVEWLDATEAESTLAISSVTEMELLVGSRNKTHMTELLGLMSRFQVIEIDSQISNKARELIREYYLSHGLLIADALIAATAIITGEKFATRNRRDFRFIKDLHLLDYP